MRLFLNYNSDMLQKKSERVTLPYIETTDELIYEIGSKLSQEFFSIRFNIDGEYVRVIPGWYLSHYGIRHGSSLHLEFYQKNVQSEESVADSGEVYSTRPHRKLSKIEEEMEEEEHLRTRQETAFSKMSDISSNSNEESGFDDDLYKLLKAAKEGELSHIKEIIESDRRFLNEFGESGWALIHYAVFYDHKSILLFLMSKGVNLNLITSDGWNPLQLSIKKKNIEIFQILVKGKGIDINQVTQKGTALHHAVKMNLLKFVDILVDNKVDDSLKDDSGKTAVEICEHDQIRQSLILSEKELVQEEPKEQEPETKLGVYRGVIYRVRFLTYAIKQNYLVCDPYQGTLKRYESKDQYPKKPKEVIPLLQVSKVEMVKKKNMSILMRNGYYYFQVYYPDKFILAVKEEGLAKEWVKVIYNCCSYAHKHQANTIHPVINKHETVEMLDEEERKKERRKEKERLKAETGFKKSKEQAIQDPKAMTPKPKTTRESVFSEHLSETVILQSQSIRMDMGRSLMTPPLHRAGSQNYANRPRFANTQNTRSNKNQSPQVQRFSRFDQPKQADKQSWSESRSQSKSKSRSKNRSIISSESQQENRKENFSTMAEQAKVGISSFQIMKQIGSGSFGKVFKAKLIRTKEVFALKAFKKSTLIAKKHLKYAVGQANILKKLSSPFIIQLHYAFQTPQYLYLCLDYCPNKDLSEYLAVQQGGVISEQQSKLIIAQIVLAVEHMHNQGVIYRDMKPENVLIGQDGFIRMADFGLSRNDSNLCASFCGSPAYLSPQMLKQKGVGKQSDIYGIGCILYQMLIGQPPYYNEDMEVLYENIQKGNLKFTNRISSSAKQLIQKLLERDPLRRISIDKMKQHPFFNDINFESVSAKEVGQLTLESSDIEEEEDESILLAENKKPIFIDADYTDDKKINKVSNFSFSKPSS